LRGPVGHLRGELLRLEIDKLILFALLLPDGFTLPS
jgi:hypothetical protein